MPRFGYLRYVQFTVIDTYTVKSVFRLHYHHRRRIRRIGFTYDSGVDHLLDLILDFSPYRIRQCIRPAPNQVIMN